MNASDLSEYGIDYLAGVSRCLDNESFYHRLLAMFLDDDCCERAHAAWKSQNYEALFKCAHELKGASGSVALTALSASSGALVEYLRGGGSDSAKIDALYAALEAAYTRTREGVLLFLADKPQ